MRTFVFLAALSAAVVTIGFQNCSQSLPPAAEDNGSSNGSSLTPAGSGIAAYPISLAPSSATIAVGETLTVIASAGTAPYRFSADNAAVASVDPASGVVTGVASGAALITVNDSVQGSGTAAVTVVPAPVTVNSPKVNGGYRIRSNVPAGSDVDTFRYISLNRYCQENGYVKATAYQAAGPGGAVCIWSGNAWTCDGSCSGCGSISSVTCAYH